MIISDWIASIAGFFILASLALGVDCGYNPLFVSKYWLFFTTFVGANLFQSGFTKSALGTKLKLKGTTAPAANCFAAKDFLKI